jgi:hypothetical protein
MGQIHKGTIALLGRLPNLVSRGALGPGLVPAVGIVLVLVFSGCQGEIVPVAGNITLNGKPLAGAVVTFQPVGTRQRGASQPEATGSVGRTDALGHYTLRQIQPDRVGAIVGDHAVTISLTTAGRTDADRPKASRLPKAWSDGTKRFRVPPGGTSQANFEIK